jgi:hypothetical protein
MPRPFMSAGLFAVAACLVLTGCNSSPSTPSVPAPSNISGDYSGTVQDAQGGAGTATGTLAQHGANAGGSITDTEAGATLNAQISLTIASSNHVSGTIVIDYPNNGPTCTFSTKGAYSTSTHVLSGSYSAVTNCAGDTGTYSLTQQCTDTVTSGYRRMIGGIAAC